MKSSESTFPRRQLMLRVGLAAAAAGLGVAWWRLQPGAGHPQAVKSFWNQRFEQVNGDALDMGGFRGKPLLVNFWATWCPPCVEELPMIEAFWREHAGKGFQVVALAIDQPSSVRRFLTSQALSFPIGLAGLGGSELSKSLGNLTGGLPFSVFFRADGSIYRQKLGQLTLQDLQNWIKA